MPLISLAAGMAIGVVLAREIGREKARRAKRLKPEAAVFLLCDVQEKFRGIIDRMPHVIATAQAMLKCADKMGIPVVVTEQYPKFFQATVAELDVSKATVFAKTRFSMCTDEVVACLRAHGRRSVVLFGVEAHVCVQQTALDLLELGYEVHVVADGVSSQRAPDRATALQRIQVAGAVVTSAESVFFELLRSKEAPAFKDVSKIAKELAEAVVALGDSRLL
mmetsp:Transcript_56876/g.165154  ORF Transcript_56876/g.165154 Transcript_56876/m.165154 type:complete len:221 (-) Transcript_56876:107-769(-)